MSEWQRECERIAAVDWSAAAAVQARLDNLTKPRGSLGRLEELARRMVVVTGREHPGVTDKVVFVMAADHGVAAEGVSAFPSEVTTQMVLNFLNGGAGINVLARQAGARVVVGDVGVAGDLPRHPELYSAKVARGTANMAAGPAMSRAQAECAVEAGMRIFAAEYAKGIDLVATGEMGIANTTAASAVTAAVTGRAAREVTGRGTGIDDRALEHKISVVQRALQVNRPDGRDGFDVLAKVGGFEIGGLAGVILAAAARRVPVLVDGFISGAAALIACAIEPKAVDYLIAAHRSVERGHAVLLDHLGLEPLLDLGLRLGEGTGAALAFHLVEAGVRILGEMATFASAGVSDRSDG